MRSDVIVSWPDNCDYPLWRAFIQDNREHFGKVIVVFTESNSQPNYKEFVKKQMSGDDITFLDNPMFRAGEDDWRNVAINEALKHVTSEWIWFTEQDFMLRVPVPVVLFFVGDKTSAVFQGERMHPCCIFIKHETLKTTRCNFGIIPDKADHFSMIQDDLNYEHIVAIPEHMYHHMNGLSHNMRLMHEGQKVTYKPQEFTEYLDIAMQSNIVKDPRMIEKIKQYLSVHK